MKVFLSSLLLIGVFSGVAHAQQDLADGMRFRVGETAILSNQYVTIATSSNQNPETYSVRFANSGEVVPGYSGSMLYKTHGCMNREEYPLCVGNQIIVNDSGQYAMVVGRAFDYQGVKYALQFGDGSIDTGYFRNMISLP